MKNRKSRVIDRNPHTICVALIASIQNWILCSLFFVLVFPIKSLSLILCKISCCFRKFCREYLKTYLNDDNLSYASL